MFPFEKRKKKLALCTTIESDRGKSSVRGVKWGIKLFVTNVSGPNTNGKVLSRILKVLILAACNMLDCTNS